MKDDRILRAFGELDHPVAPESEFARVLYERLAADLGLRPRPGVLARILGQVTVRPHAAPRAGSTNRLGFMFAAVVVAVAVVAGGALFAAGLPPMPPAAQLASPSQTTAPTPSRSPQGDAAATELVRLSQAAQADPPAVRYVLQVSGMPVTLPNGEEADTWTTTVSTDGQGTWRTEGPDDVAGGYALYDGDRYASYGGITRSWEVTPVENGGPPFPMNDAFGWADVSYPGEVATLKTLECAGATSRGETVVAGRTADRVWCPTLQADYTLDRTTHLVLGLVLHATSGTLVAPGAKEVTSFEEITPDPAAFDWAGPVIARRTAGPIEGTKLAVGERPPAWSGSTITGKRFSTERLTGPSAILFLCLDCLSGATVYDRFTEAAAAHPGIRAVIVGQDAELGTLTGFVGQHPTDAVVISDVNSEFPTAWGYPYYGGLVMLGSGGKVADVLPTRISAEDYDRVFTAAERGQPIPVPSGIDGGATAASPAPAASPSPASASPEPWCVEELVVCHNAGWPAPAWTGATPDGSTFDSATLAGRPALVWFGDIQSRSSIAALASLADRYAGRAGVVMITSREETPGATAAVLDTMDVKLPVVLDWDASIERSFKNVTWGTILLDANGRLVAQSTRVDDPALLQELDGLVAPGP